MKKIGASFISEEAFFLDYFMKIFHTEGADNKNMKKTKFIILVLALGWLIFSDVFWFGPQKSFANVNHLTDSRSPRIDEMAAFDINEVNGESTCRTLPVELWLLLLLTYITIIVFNLTYNFSADSHLHWGWELFFTLLALWGWWCWDGCRSAVWFPLYIIKFGLVMFLSYLYFFDRKRDLE